MTERFSASIHLGGNWTMDELESFIGAINFLYKSAYVITSLAEDFDAVLKDDFSFSKTSPFFPEYFVLLEHFVRRHKTLPRGLFLSPINDPDYKDLVSAIQNDEWPIPEGDTLLLKKIEISSPGVLNIEAGKVIEQLRELIKDFAFRNRQERRRGDLRILSEEIDILKKAGFPKREIGQLLREMRNRGRTISDLSNRGLIESIKDETESNA